MGNKYTTVKEIGKHYPFTPATIRHFIFTNQCGFNRCVIKLKKRVYIDLEEFGRWLEEHKVKKNKT